MKHLLITTTLREYMRSEDQPITEYLQEKIIEDESGNTIMEELFDEDGLMESVKREFNIIGNMITEEQYHRTTGCRTIVNYQYNEKGKTISITEKNVEEDQETKALFEYKEDENLIICREYLAEELHKTQFTRHNDQEQILSEEIIYETDEFGFSEFYEYNESGLLISRYQVEEENEKMRTEYVYDLNERLILEAKYFEGILQYELHTEYMQNDRLRSITQINPGDIQYTLRTEIEYNDDALEERINVFGSQGFRQSSDMFKKNKEGRLILSIHETVAEKIRTELTTEYVWIL